MILISPQHDEYRREDNPREIAILLLEGWRDVLSDSDLHWYWLLDQGVYPEVDKDDK